MVLGMMVLGVSSLAAEKGAKTAPSNSPMYRFDCVLTKANEKGEKKRLREEFFVSLEGKPVKYHAGDSTVVRVPDEKVEYVPHGFSAEMTTWVLDDGSLRLDVTIHYGARPQTTAGRLCFRSMSVRTINEVKPKQPSEFTVGPYTFEVKVQPAN